MKGTELQELRDEKKVTQEELARRLDINARSVQRYEVMEELPVMVELAARVVLD